MSYNLYLTHKKHWYDEKSPRKISRDSLKKYLEINPNVKIAEEDKERIHLEYFLDLSDKEPYFYFMYDEGDISTTSNQTDKHALKMLLEMAKFLGVSVRGEEDEVYTKDDLEWFKTYEQMEEDRKRVDQMTRGAKAFKKRLLWIAVFIVPIVAIISFLIFSGR